MVGIYLTKKFYIRPIKRFDINNLLLLPFGEGSVITATPNVKCRYLKQGTATEDCGQGISLGFRSTSKDGLLNLTAKAGMDRIGSETTSSLKLQFEKRF